MHPSQPEDTLGTGISAQKRSKIDELWTSMNADDSVAIRRNDGRAPEKKTKGKKGKIKASKKANKVTDTESIQGAREEAGNSCLKHLGRRSF